MSKPGDSQTSESSKHDVATAAADHSLPNHEVEEVRKQLDYYFSDENLRTDKFLLGKMRGRKNRPVPVKIIHSFHKMQRYQPLSAVIAALSGCENVDVLKATGVWCVQRKTPFILDNVPGLAAQSKPTRNKPTGFEEFYADGPTTAADAEQEEELYQETRPVMERIETALQRYQAKRKFSNRLRNVFDKWLRFGGVEAGQKMFSGGLDPAFVEESSAADIAAMTATSYIGDEKKLGDFEQKWSVAFENVAKSFFSAQVPLLWDWNQKSEISEATSMLRNFYNYLLHHNVCPEYQEDLLAARKFMDLAEKELLATNRAMALFPGDFNIACSALFGGFYRGLYAESSSWKKSDGVNPISIGLSDQRAVQVFKFGIAQYASEDLFDADQMDKTRSDYLKWQIVKTEVCTDLEISHVLPADEETRTIYRQTPGNLKSLGRMRCRAWTPPDFAEDDLPPGVSCDRGHEQYEFYVEDEILTWLSVGMKIQATVLTMSSGVQFIDQVTSVKCSFYLLLENELMLKFQEPRTITREEQLEKEKAGVGEDDDGGEAVDLE